MLGRGRGRAVRASRLCRTSCPQSSLRSAPTGPCRRAGDTRTRVLPAPAVASRPPAAAPALPLAPGRQLQPRPRAAALRCRGGLLWIFPALADGRLFIPESTFSTLAACLAPDLYFQLTHRASFSALSQLGTLHAPDAPPASHSSGSSQLVPCPGPPDRLLRLPLPPPAPLRSRGLGGVPSLGARGRLWRGPAPSSAAPPLPCRLPAMPDLPPSVPTQVRPSPLCLPAATESAAPGLGAPRDTQGQDWLRGRGQGAKSARGGTRSSIQG